MKKILLLGGSAQQVIAIEKAKELGYYTVLCDFLEDNPGQYVADKFYLVSTTDKETVLEVARKEKIDGIVAYSSDPAAPTAAFVADRLNLVGVPYETAESFCNKNIFRKFLEKNGFNVPRSVEIYDKTAIGDVMHLNFPIIVKPTDSSGSKGVTVLKNSTCLKEALEFAAEYSRNGIIIAEEYIERDHEDVIETEIFVIDGIVCIWGIMSSVRDTFTNPLIPAAYSYPANLSKSRFLLVKDEVQRLVDCSGVKNGAFNIEMVITVDEKLYFFDAGPRNGGNMLPEYISMIASCDVPSITIYAAMNEIDKIPSVKLDGNEGGFWGLYVIHSDRKGKLERVDYSELAQKSLIREVLFKNIGSEINAFENSRDAIGLAFFEFENIEDRDKVLRDFSGNHIKVILG